MQDENSHGYRKLHHYIILPTHDERGKTLLPETFGASAATLRNAQERAIFRSEHPSVYTGSELAAANDVSTDLTAIGEILSTMFADFFA